MHEAGIAAAVAAEVRERGLDPDRLRLVVSGGHGDEVAFDAALRAHLEAAAPGLRLERVAIVHAPVPRLCASCATAFEAPLSTDPCPACGGPGLAIPRPETVELESTDGEAERMLLEEAPHDESEHAHGVGGERGHVHRATGALAGDGAEGPLLPLDRDSRHSDES